MRVISAVEHWYTRIISAFAAIILLSMVMASALQIFLRNLMNTGIPGVDQLLRHGVLWIAMLGGTLATRYGRQIGIDLVNRYAGPTVRKIVAWITGLFTIIVCAFLTKASWAFVISEKEFGNDLLEGLPAWYLQLIIPVGFTLIIVQLIFNFILGRQTGELTIEGAPVDEEPEQGSQEELSGESAFDSDSPVQQDNDEDRE